MDPHFTFSTLTPLPVMKQNAFYILLFHVSSFLPPSFECNERNLERIGTFLDNLERRSKNLVEFRHSSWWDERVYRMFEEKSALFCTVAGLSMPDDVVVTGDTAYFNNDLNAYATQNAADLKKAV